MCSGEEDEEQEEDKFLRHFIFNMVLCAWASVIAVVGIIGADEKKNCPKKEKCCEDHYDFMFPSGVFFAIFSCVYFIIACLRWCTPCTVPNVSKFVQPIVMFLNLIAVITVILLVLPKCSHSPTQLQMVVAILAFIFPVIFVWYMVSYICSSCRGGSKGSRAKVPFTTKEQMNYLLL